MRLAMWSSSSAPQSGWSVTMRVMWSVAARAAACVRVVGVVFMRDSGCSLGGSWCRLRVRPRAAPGVLSGGGGLARVGGEWGADRHDQRDEPVAVVEVDRLVWVGPPEGDAGPLGSDRFGLVGQVGGVESHGGPFARGGGFGLRVGDGHRVGVLG